VIDDLITEGERFMHFLSAQKTYALIAYLISSVVFFNASKLLAADIKHEISLFIPLSFVEKNVEKKFDNGQQNFNKTIVRNNISITADEIPILIQQIKIDISGPIKMNNYELSSKLNVVAHVDAIQIHQQVSKIISGIPVNIHVDIDCQPFLITNDALDMQSLWSFTNLNNHLNAEIKNISLATKNPWNVSNIQCTGSSGVGDLITQKIREKLASIDIYKDLIATELQSNINSLLNDSLVELRKTQNIQAVSDKVLTLVNEIPLYDIGFVFIYTSQENTVDNALIQTKIKDETKSFLQNKNYQNPVAIIDQNDFTNLITNQLTGKTIEKDLQSFPGFQSLMKSRFKQFFAWPDLMNYAKNTSFPTISKLSKLSELKIDNWSGSSGSGHLSAQIDSKVMSQRSNKPYVYLRASSNYQGQFFYQIVNGNIQIQSNLVGFKNNLAMDSQYIKQFRARSKIPVQIINSSLQDSLKQLMTSYQLPKLKGSTVNYQTTTIDENTGDLFIQMEPEDQK